MFGSAQLSQERINRAEKCGSTRASDRAGDDVPKLQSGTSSGGKEVTDVPSG